MGPTGLNQFQNEVFLHFFEFGSLVFLEAVCNDSLQQSLTSSRDKTREKKILGSKFGANGPKLGLKGGFSPFFQVWFISFL